MYGYWCQATLVCILALSLPSLMSIEKSLNLSKPNFMGDMAIKNSTSRDVVSSNEGKTLRALLGTK